MKKWQWSGYGLLALAIMLLAGWYYVVNGATVYRTAWGFFPSEITVPIGTTVTFQNLTPGLMWPASDLHPTHAIDSDFDPRRTIDAYASWSYTFDRKGMWTFHDHIASQFIGQVTVYDETGDTSLDCADLDREACWRIQIEQALIESGVPAAFTVLAELHRTEPDFVKSCHTYSHDIGLKAYVYYGIDVPFGPETAYCNAGFYHGFVEGLIDDETDIALAEKFCIETGERLKDSFALAEQQCRHGVGHGVLEYYVNHFPELLATPIELVQRAVAVCHELDNENDEFMRCASGAFNVYKDLLMVSHDFDSSKQGEEIFGLCAALQHDFEREGCYREFAKIYAIGDHRHSLVRDIKNNLAGEKDLFLLDNFMVDSDEAVYLPLATMSWGNIIGKREVLNVHDDIAVKVCGIVPQYVRSWCLRGINDGTFGASEPHGEHLSMLPLCSSDRLDGEEQTECFKHYQLNLFFTYGMAGLRAQCEFVPTEFIAPEYCGLLEEPESV